MKLYKISYEGCPSGPETSIVFANNEEEARGLAEDDLDEVTSIEEVSVPTEPEEVYTGYHCC